MTAAYLLKNPVRRCRAEQGSCGSGCTFAHGRRDGLLLGLSSSTAAHGLIKNFTGAMFFLAFVREHNTLNAIGPALVLN